MLRLPVPTDPDLRAVVDRQVQIMFVYADDVLGDVTLDECLVRPTEQSWTVHERVGRWYGELGDEPPDVPVPSLGWTMWHPVWWMTTLLAHTRGHEVPAVEAVEWPGPAATIPVLRSLWSDWMRLIAELDDAALASGALTRFPYTDGRPFAHVVGWSGMELVKNISEMGVLHRLGRDVGRRRS